MTRQYAVFNTWHPGVLAFYAFAAPILGMLTLHPCYLTVNVTMAVVVHWFYQGGKNTWKSICGLVPVILIITAFNFVFNTRGMHVLFQIGHHPFTIESLCYGLASGGMLSAVLLWFQNFNCIISNEKFLYLFGKKFPGTALLLSMIMKLFPDTRYRIQSIKYADREMVRAENAVVSQRIKKGLKQISTLMEWSMEDSIEMADSMKARGYGEKERSSWQQYHFTRADAGMAVWFTAAVCVCLWGMFFAGAEVRWYPLIQISGRPETMLAAGSIYSLFLASPLLVEWKGWWK